MKINKLITTIFLTLSLVNIAFSQEYKTDSQHDDWNYFMGKNGFYLYNTSGESVDNIVEVPSFLIQISLDQEGTIDLKLSGENLYKYDNTENDANYIDIDLIVDKNEIISYTGKLYEIKGDQYDGVVRIYFSVPNGGTKFTDLFKEMKLGNTIYIQTTGAGDPKVFKYSLNGFSDALNKLTRSWVAWKDDNENPFDK